MKRVLWLIMLLFAVSLLAIGCGEDTPTEPDGEVATTVAVVAHHQSVDLSWDGEVGALYTTFRIMKAEAGATGSYSAYISAGTTANNEMTLTGLDNAKRYKFKVETLDVNNNLVDTTNNEVETSPRPQSTGEIIWEFQNAGNSGFDLSAGEPISMVFANAANIDFYLGTGLTRNGDPTTDDLALKSPHLVQSHNDWSSRVANIAVAGTGSLDDYDVATVGSDNAKAVQNGTVYFIRYTDTGDGQIHYAKLKVTDVTTSPAGSRKITFEYAWQDTPNFPNL